MGGLLGTSKQEVQKSVPVPTVPTSKYSPWDIDPCYEQPQNYVSTTWDRESISQCENNSYRASDGATNYSLHNDDYIRYKNQGMHASLRYDTLSQKTEEHYRTEQFYATTSTKLSFNLDSDVCSKWETIRKGVHLTRVPSYRMNKVLSTYANSSNGVQEKTKYSTCTYQSYTSTFNESESPTNVTNCVEIPVSASLNSSRNVYDPARNLDSEKIKQQDRRSLNFPQPKQYAIYSYRNTLNETEPAGNIIKPSANSTVSVPTQKFDESERFRNLYRINKLILKTNYCSLIIPPPKQHETYNCKNTLDESRTTENVLGHSTSSYSSQKNDLEVEKYANYSHRSNWMVLQDIKTADNNLKSTESAVLNSTASHSSDEEWDGTKFASHRPNSIKVNATSNTFQRSENFDSNFDYPDTSQDGWDASQYLTNVEQSNSSTPCDSNLLQNIQFYQNSLNSSSSNYPKTDSSAKKYSNQSYLTSPNEMSNSIRPSKTAVSNRNISISHKKDLHSANRNQSNWTASKELSENTNLLHNVVDGSSNKRVPTGKTGDNTDNYEKSFDDSQSLNSSDILAVKNMSHLIQSSLSIIQIDSNDTSKKSKFANKKSPVKRGMNRTKKISEAIVKKCLPINWHCQKQFPMPESQIVYLPEDHSEFLEIKRSIEMSLKIRQVLTIARVENSYQYCMYLLKKLELNLGDKKCMEIRQFHGTKTKNAFSIVMDNFDWRLHGTNVGHTTGRGVSFSRLASFSSRYASDIMFVVRVLVTKFSLGDGNTVLPTNGSDTTTRIDGKVIVKFDDYTFYPEYLVTLSPAPRK